MADSIDRVFAHALQTVRRVPRAGSERPPAADRLRLYGLYKQAMEGDVEPLMPRPLSELEAQSSVDDRARSQPRTQSRPALPQPRASSASSPPPPASREERAEQEKWDAWRASGGMRRAEAKRAYVDLLIATMRRYASGSAEARELIGELEFVWEQVRGNTQAHNGGVVAEEDDQEAHVVEESVGGAARTENRPPSRPQHRRSRTLGHRSYHDASSEVYNNNSSSLDNNDQLRRRSTSDTRHQHGSHGSHQRSRRPGHSDRLRRQVSEIVRGQDGTELRVLRPISESETNPPSTSSVSSSTSSRSPATGADGNADVEEDDESEHEDGNGSPSAHRSHATWRRTIDRALVQLTAEVAAVRELVESATSGHGFGGGAGGGAGGILSALNPFAGQSSVSLHGGGDGRYRRTSTGLNNGASGNGSRVGRAAGNGGGSVGPGRSGAPGSSWTWWARFALWMLARALRRALLDLAVAGVLWAVWTSRRRKGRARLAGLLRRGLVSVREGAYEVLGGSGGGLGRAGVYGSGAAGVAGAVVDGANGAIARVGDGVRKLTGG